jgi:uncharacterized membrane protein
LTGTHREIPEAEIGYVLIAGLTVSVAVILIGILGYAVQSGGSSIEYTAGWQMTGPDFFAYLWNLLVSLSLSQSPVATMSLGVVLLMLTSYVRVLATAVVFAFSKSAKYTLISLLVFLLLTLTLVTH